MSERKDLATRQSQQPENVRNRPVAAPPVDVYENSDQLLVVADVPGVSSANVHIHFDKGQLVIEAHATQHPEGLTPLSREFSAVDYRRTFQVAPGIDVDRISASLANGVLSVTLPKSAELKPRQIHVKAG